MADILASPRATDRWRVAAVALGLYAAVGGFISFLGWAADVPRLADWNNGSISIQPNTTLAAMAAGLALLAAIHGRDRAVAALGAFVAIIGATALVQYVTGVNLGIDTLLMFDREWGRGGVMFPGRMGPPGATSWLLIGSAFLLVSSPGERSRRRALVPVLALTTAAIATLSITGYIYGASSLFTLPTLTVIALQTATFILAISVGLLLSVAEQGPIRLLREQGPAGILVRRILPALVVVPFVVGLLRLSGERAGLYDLAFGTAMRTIVEIALLLGLLFWTAGTISRHARARERAEQSVEASEQRLRTIFETVGVALWEQDISGVQAMLAELRSEGVTDFREHFRTHPELVAVALGRVRVLDVNDTAVAMFQAAGKADLVSSLPRVMRAEALPMFAEQLLALSEGGSSFQGEALLHTPTGQPVYVFLTMVVLQARGAEGRALVSVVDLTERQRMETALRQSRLQLEADLADSVLLQRISAEIIHENDVQSLYQKLVDSAIVITHARHARMQVIQPGPGAGVPGGARLLAAGGDDTGIRVVSSTPLVSRSGAVLGVLSMHWTEPYELSPRQLRLLDILARQAADLVERLQNEEALRDADRRKDQFLMTLAHELRNPLAPVRSAVDLMKQKPSPDSDLTRARDVIDRQLSLMARLLDDLMDVGRIAHDRLELRLQRVDLRSLVRGAVEMCEPLVQRFQHRLHVDLPQVPIYLQADPARLGQVVGNLLNNACRYTEPGGHIRIAAERLGTEVVVTISDTGIGIPPANLSSIFEMFSQVDSSLERSRGGLGIGLHLVKRLVEMHGGQIEAASEGPSHGSTFTLRLPVAATSDLDGLKTRVAEDAPMPRARRILVVDDNKDAASMLAMLLDLSAHTTEVAHDGPGALVAAESFRPDVILLDLGLPGLNGYEVCRRIRDHAWGAGIVIIALTGWGQEPDRQRSREAGFNGHLVKPVEHETLLEMLAMPDKATL